MVKKIFLEDPYQKTCKAIITQIDENKIQLDQTIFYAFAGGQISDIGTIGKKQVLQAVKISDSGIEYELENTDSLNIGDEVNIVIDWEHRYNLMKLHSAQHVVADLFEQITGINTTLGSNVRANKATLTYPTDEPLIEILKEVEEKVNQFIKENHEVKRFVSDLDSNRWVYECGEFSCPCGGTHVKNTSEIGDVKLKRKSGGKGKETIEIILE